MEKIGLLIGFLLYASISTIRSNRRRKLEKEHKIVNDLKKNLKEDLKDIGDINEH